MTRSLARQLESVHSTGELAPGDVIVQPGSPGHAVIVLDVAREAQTDRRVFLLGQGYMPAQDMHVLKNPDNATLSPWYDWSGAGPLRTPEWTFERPEIRRFADAGEGGRPAATSRPARRPPERRD